MKIQISKFEAVDLLKNVGFTYDGATALYEYLEEQENLNNEDFLLDPVGLRCDFAEYKDMSELMDDYNHLDDYQEVLENTIVIEHETGIIIQSF